MAFRDDREALETKIRVQEAEIERLRLQLEGAAKREESGRQREARRKAYPWTDERASAKQPSEFLAPWIMYLGLLALLAVSVYSGCQACSGRVLREPHTGGPKLVEQKADAITAVGRSADRVS